MKLSQPWPEGYTINARSPYGWRIHPITGKRKFHHGVDVAGLFPLTAPADGIVEHKGRGGSGGNTLIIKHASDLYTVYYHLREESPLRKGERVRTGEYIGHSGNTGASTGAHLHWEVRKSRRWGDTLDPVPFLTAAPSVSRPLLKVDGKLGRNTWRAFQEALKEAGFYKGIPDGRPGVMTYRAVQAWSGAKVDGVFGPATRRAVQGKLGVKQDGVFGRITVSALQRAINEGKI